MGARGVLICCLLTLCCVAVTSYPIHASCKLTWLFSLQCGKVHGLLVEQMEEWNMSAPCGTSEKCGYTITYNSAYEIKGTHTTPVHKYVDDLTMDFSGSSSACTVKGSSVSEIYYAVLDQGTNYCNLHNLVVGSGLVNTTGFKEVTDDTVCTQYSVANCDKY